MPLHLPSLQVPDVDGTHDVMIHTCNGYAARSTHANSFSTWARGTASFQHHTLFARNIRQFLKAI